MKKLVFTAALLVCLSCGSVFCADTKITEPSKFYFMKTDPAGTYPDSVTLRKIRPEASSETLLNPHRGVATFQNFNGDELFPGAKWSEKGPLKFDPGKADVKTVKGYLPSTVAYCRWYWNVFEPERDKYDWSMVEGAFKTAKARGQTLQVRLMPAGDDLPSWYAKIAPVKMGLKANRLEPDYDSDEYFELWSAVIKAFAAKFGKDPALESFDVAFLGPWGEGAGIMLNRNIEKFVDMYARYLDSSILLSNIDGHQYDYGISVGLGWRCDCFGDMINAGKGYVPDGLGWNHTFDYYPKAIYEGKAGEAWRTRPVVFETCHNPAGWRDRNMPLEYLDFIIAQGLKNHCTVLMPKYSVIPDEYFAKIVEFEKKLGYRFVLRQIRYNKSLSAEGKFVYEMWMDNAGVAPIYRKGYALAFRFTQDGKSGISLSSQDITKWLPGDTWISEAIKLSPDFTRAVDIQVETALVNIETKTPAVKIAIKGVQEDGWFPVGIIKAENPAK